MDPQIASQLLGTLVQVSGTILAVYVAVILYILQEKSLAQLLLKPKYFYVSFGASCAGFSTIILFSLGYFLLLKFEQPFSDSAAFYLVLGFAISLLLLFVNCGIVIWLRRKVLRKRRRKIDV